jgi:hypothetical protein
MTSLVAEVAVGAPKDGIPGTSFVTPRVTAGQWRFSRNLWKRLTHQPRSLYVPGIATATVDMLMN